MLVFAAPDQNDMEALKQAVREFLAWESINEEREPLNLDAQQSRQVRNSLEKADETANLRVRGSYSWLLTPVQPEPLGSIEFQANRISGDDNIYDRVARKLRQDGLLINEWSPDILRMELERYIWNEGNGWTVGLKQMWEYLAQYCYLPRLFDQDVLLTAVRNGIRRQDAPLAYATGVSDEGYHTGLLYKDSGQVYFDEQSILIHPDHLKIAPPPPPKPGTGPLTTLQVREPGPQIETSPPTADEPRLTTRYYGRVDLNPQRVNREMGLIVEEVIERLTSLVGCEVEITLEISARLPEGFDEATIRTVSENSRTLKFENFEFEVK
jgi:hypothetical protein